jgi:hypothetical protein
MLLLLQRSFSLFLIFSLINHVQQVDITGIWYFDRFGGPHGEIDKSTETVKANKLNKGLMITFTKDGKLISTQPGGAKQNNSKVEYKVSYKLKQVIIGTDTLRIMLLTSEILELYPKNESRPALFLKRSKDGKTLMSAS